MLVVFTAIIIMTIRKIILKRKLEINQQHEVELNSYEDHPISFELDDQFMKRLGELPSEPIYDYINELPIEAFKIEEEECGDIQQQSCSSGLQEKNNLKANVLLNSSNNFDDYVTMNAVVISDN